MPKTVVAWFMSAILIAACATIPAQLRSTAPDAACLKGNAASYMDFVHKGEAHVRFSEFDGAPIDTLDQLCFTPGTHRVAVHAMTNYQKSKENYLELDLAASRRYWLHGGLVGPDFLIKLDDITTLPGTTVQEFKLKSFGMAVTIPVGRGQFVIPGEKE